MGAGKIIKVTWFNCSFCCKMFRSRHDLKIHQLTCCVLTIETKEVGQKRSFGVQTMNLSTDDTNPGYGVIKYASGASDIIHPTNEVRYPALFDRQHPQVSKEFTRTFPDKGVTWPSALRDPHQQRFVSAHSSVFAN